MSLSNVKLTGMNVFLKCVNFRTKIKVIYFFVYHKTEGLVDADTLQVMGQGPEVVMFPSLEVERVHLTAKMELTLRAFLALRSICKDRKKNKRKWESADGAWRLWIVFKSKKMC